MNNNTQEWSNFSGVQRHGEIGIKDEEKH